MVIEAYIADVVPAVGGVAGDALLHRRVFLGDAL
jgi:hypothetical protein